MKIRAFRAITTLLRTFLTNDSEEPEKQDGRSIRTDCGTKMSESANIVVKGVMKHPPRIRRFSLDVLELFLARDLILEGRKALKIQEKSKMFL